jgi:hypothetical protein
MEKGFDKDETRYLRWRLYQIQSSMSTGVMTLFA